MLSGQKRSIIRVPEFEGFQLSLFLAIQTGQSGHGSLQPVRGVQNLCAEISDLLALVLDLNDRSSRGPGQIVGGEFVKLVDGKTGEASEPTDAKQSERFIFPFRNP